MDPAQNNFGPRLHALVERKGVTIAQFAHDVKIGESQAFNWFKLSKPPLAKHWPKLCNYFGVSESYLITGIPDDGNAPKKYPDAEGRARGAVNEDQAPYGTSDDIAREVRRHFENLIAAAQGDPERLHWIAVQMKEHLATPKSWRLPVQGIVDRVVLPSQKARPHPSPSQAARSA